MPSSLPTKAPGPAFTLTGHCTCSQGQLFARAWSRAECGPEVLLEPLRGAEPTLPAFYRSSDPAGLEMRRKHGLGWKAGVEVSRATSEQVASGPRDPGRHGGQRGWCVRLRLQRPGQ